MGYGPQNRISIMVLRLCEPTIDVWTLKRAKHPVKMSTQHLLQFSGVCVWAWLLYRQRQWGTWQTSTLWTGVCWECSALFYSRVRGGHMTWEAWMGYHWRAPRWAEGLCGHFANRRSSVLLQPEKPLSGGRWPPDEAVSLPSGLRLNCCWRRCCSTWLSPSDSESEQVLGYIHVSALGWG